MSKVEETNALIETLIDLIENGADIDYQRAILVDMAKSLAIIADAMSGKENNET